MRTIVELSQKDIVKILAKHFDIDESSVTISMKESWEGQGPMERKVHVASARIILKEGMTNENT